MIKKLFTSSLIAAQFFMFAPQITLAQDAIVTNRARQVAPMNYDEIAAILITKISALNSVRGVSLDKEIPNALDVEYSTKLIVRMENLQKRINRPGANRDFEINNFVKIIADTIDKRNPYKIQNFRLIVRTKTALEEFEQQTAVDGKINSIIRKPFLDNLEEAIVADTASSIAFVPVSELKYLNLSQEEAFMVAQNTFSQIFKDLQWNKYGNLQTATIDGALDTGILFIPEIWNNFAQSLKSDPAVIIPNRGLIVVGAANSDNDLKKLAEIAKKEAVGPHAITDKVLIWRNNQWSIYH